MARQHGQVPFVTATNSGSLGDDLNNTSAVGVRIFTATERVTIDEVGCIFGDIANYPAATFAFKVAQRVFTFPAGVATKTDTTIPLFKSSFAAEGGSGATPILVGTIDSFTSANNLTNNIVVAGNVSVTTGKGNCLRAFTEVTLQKGDQLVFIITTTGGASKTGVFYASGYYSGKGLVEAQDVEST